MMSSYSPAEGSVGESLSREISDVLADEEEKKEVGDKVKVMAVGVHE